MRASAARTSGLPEFEASLSPRAGPSPSDQSNIRDSLPGEVLVLQLVHHPGHGLPVSIAWPLKGGLWDAGARALPEAVPSEPPLEDLDLAVGIAAGLREPDDAGQAWARSIRQRRPCEGDTLHRCVAYALELLGVSNRQIRLYARKNFEVACFLLGGVESADLLRAALRQRATIEPFIRALEDQPGALGDSFNIRAALRAVELGGVDAGLSPEDAQANAAVMVEQVGGGGDLAALGLSPAMPSVASLAREERVPDSLLSIAPMADPQAWDDRLAGRLGRMRFAESGLRLPSEPAGGSQTVSGSLKRKRGASSVFALDVGPGSGHDSDPELERPLVRQRLRRAQASVAALEIPSLSVRHDFVLKDQTKFELPWLRAAQRTLLRAEHESVHRLVGDAAVRRWLASGRIAGLVAHDRVRSEAISELSAQDALGWSHRLPKLQQLSWLQIERFALEVGGEGSGERQRVFPRPRVFPLVPAFCASTTTLAEGLALRPAKDLMMIGYPLGQDLSGRSPESVVQAVFVMTRLMFACHFDDTTQGLVSDPVANTFNALGKSLLRVSRLARVPPTPNIDHIDAYDPQSAVARAQSMVIDELAAAVANRVLRLPAGKDSIVTRQTWRSIVNQAMEQIGEADTLCHGLIRGEATSLARAFGAIDQAAKRWLAAARPAVRQPAMAGLVRNLLRAANAGRNRDDEFIHEEVVSRLEDNLWLFMASPCMGAEIRGGRFVPAPDHMVGFIQDAVLRQRLADGYAEEAAMRIIDSCVLALVSRDREGLYNLLDDLAVSAAADPQRFAVEFMGDIAAPRR